VGADRDWGAYLAGAGHYSRVDLNTSATAATAATAGNAAGAGAADTAEGLQQQQQGQQWEVPAQLRAAFAGAPPVPAHVSWAGPHITCSGSPRIVSLNRSIFSSTLAVLCHRKLTCVTGSSLETITQKVLELS